MSSNELFSCVVLPVVFPMASLEQAVADHNATSDAPLITAEEVTASVMAAVNEYILTLFNTQRDACEQLMAAQDTDAYMSQLETLASGAPESLRPLVIIALTYNVLASKK